MIFGFLSKFWILIYFFEKAYYFFRNRKKNLENVREPVTRVPHDCDALGELLAITQCITVVGSSCHGFSNVFKIFFDFEKNNMFFRKNILKSKICSGIRKSHLENCTSILKIPNRKNRLFFLITLQIRLYSIPGWRILCVRPGLGATTELDSGASPG